MRESESGMESDSNRHLSGIDCERLIQGGDARADWARGDAEKHLEECAVCSRLMEQFRIESDRLHALRARTNAKLRDDCPDGGRWFLLTAGLEYEEESARLLDHAAGCDACGAMLKIALEDSGVDELPVEIRQIASDRSARKIAAQSLASGERKSQTPFRWLGYLGWAAAAAASIAVLVVAARMAGIGGPGPEKLLARAYEANRTWKVRFPGAAYAALKTDERSGSSRSTPLLEAEALLSKELDKSPQDSRLLDLQSRAAFLRHRYDDAIAPLERLASAPNASVQVWVDLGTAYLARCQANQAVSDCTAAVNHLSHAMAQQPANAIALFNRALSYESLFLWDQAMKDWNAYLLVDGDSGWALEAREHLAAIQEKKTRGGATSGN